MKNAKAKNAGILFTLLLLVYFLYQIFSGYLILPQYFKIGPLEIHCYGIIMALAVASAFYLAIKRSAKYGIDAKNAEDLLFWLIIGGFIGARLYHVASSFNYYLAHPADIIKVWNGGLSIYGAVFGGLLTLLLYPIKTDQKEGNPPNGRFTRVTLVADWLTPSLIVGQIIGRFGNLFNYEAFGYPTNLPWKMFVPYQFRPINYLNFNFFHPFFLYEVLGNAIILFLLIKLVKSKIPGAPSSAKASEGKLFFSYLLLYNVLRFGLEFLRVDSTFIGIFRLNAVVSLVLAILSAITLLYIKKDVKVP